MSGETMQSQIMGLAAEIRSVGMPQPQQDEQQAPAAAAAPPAQESFGEQNPNLSPEPGALEGEQDQPSGVEAGQQGDDPDDGGEQDTGEDGQREEGGEIRTITQLARELDVEPSEIYALEVPMGGGAAPVPVGVLKDQLQAAQKEVHDFQQREQALAEREKQVEQVGLQTVAQAQQVPQEILEAASNMRALKNAYDAYDWDALQKTDPAQFSSLRLRFQDAMGQAQGQFQVAQQKVMQGHQQMLQAERTKLLDKVREWRNPEVLRQEWDQMSSYLQEGYGITPQDLGQVSDHRLLAAFRRLAQLEAHGRAAESTMRTVQKSPRGLRTGALRRPGNRNTTAADKLAKRAKQTRSKEDIHAAQKSLLQLGGLI